MKIPQKMAFVQMCAQYVSAYDTVKQQSSKANEMCRIVDHKQSLTFGEKFDIKKAQEQFYKASEICRKIEPQIVKMFVAEGLIDSRKPYAFKLADVMKMLGLLS